VKERLKALSSYRWSSYPSYLRGKGPVTTSGGRLVAFRPRSAGPSALSRYVEEAIRSSHEKSPRQNVKAGFLLGAEEFLEQIRERIRGDAREQPGLKEITWP
jgi:hypothetical protein